MTIEERKRSDYRWRFKVYEELRTHPNKLYNPYSMALAVGASDLVDQRTIGNVLINLVKSATLHGVERASRGFYVFPAEGANAEVVGPDPVIETIINDDTHCPAVDDSNVVLAQVLKRNPNNLILLIDDEIYRAEVIR